MPSKTTCERWLVFYISYIEDEKFHYVKYYHRDRVYGWTDNIADAHRFFTKKKADAIARQKGGTVDLHPKCRYG